MFYSNKDNFMTIIIIGLILTFWDNNFHFMNNGYSSQRLIALYIIGGYFGKYIIIKSYY